MPSELFRNLVAEEEAQRLLDEARKSFNYQVTDFTAELLSNKFKLEAEREGDIFVPPYQRKLVWTEDRQSYFIESLLLRVPVPPLFLYDVRGRLEIIDGSQRLRTVRRFMTDELMLQDLEKLDFLNGYRFSDLPPAAQLRFKNSPIRTFVLTEDTDGVTRFDIFRRLNTSGKRLTDAEIRIGAFPGPFMELIKTCSEEKRFTVLCPIGRNADASSERQELVLRFFTYSEKYEEFVHDVRAFLDQYLIEANKKPENELQAKKKDFDQMVEFVSEKFPYGFRRAQKTRITPRVRFEAIAVGTLLALKSGQPIRRQNLDWLDEKEFKGLVRTDASNSGPKLRGRIEFVRDKLLGTR